MGANHRRAAVVLLVLACLGAAPGDDAPGAPEVRALLEVSGLDESLRSMQHSIGAQAAAQLGARGEPITAQEAAELSGVYAAAFDAERIRSCVQEAVLADFDAGKARHVIAWYGSPAGRKLRAAAMELGAEGGQDKLTLWAQGLQADPPSPARLELVRRLDVATAATEQFATLVGTLSVAMARGLESAMPPPHGEQTSDAELAQTLTAVRAELEPLMRQQARLVLLYSTREMSEAELAAYVAEAEGPASRWFNETSFRGLERGFSDASRVLGQALGAWLPSRLDAAALAAQRDRGNAFGTGRVDRECVDAALQRDAACAEFACHFAASSFMEGCLEAARATQSLCVAVPEPEQVAATVEWRVAGCARMGRRDDFCRHLLQRVQEHCYTKPGGMGA
jgi:hypothetical protein